GRIECLLERRRQFDARDIKAEAKRPALIAKPSETIKQTSHHRGAVRDRVFQGQILADEELRPKGRRSDVVIHVGSNLRGSVIAIPSGHLLGFVEVVVYAYGESIFADAIGRGRHEIAHAGERVPYRVGPRNKIQHSGRRRIPACAGHYITWERV